MDRAYHSWSVAALEYACGTAAAPLPVAAAAAAAAAYHSGVAVMYGTHDGDQSMVLGTPYEDTGTYAMGAGGQSAVKSTTEGEEEVADETARDEE